ncbi:MAG: ribosome silencing factor [Chlamydiales bacterium]|nr:ribosome silencing factor [Chlamydiales bacterium]
MKNDPVQFLSQIAQILFDKKGFNILALDVQKVSTLTDFFIIAEGNVDKHVIALAKEVISALKKEGESPIHVEGLDQGDWVVIDYLELVIHLFKPGIREKYRLEELWHEGKIVDLDLKLSEVNL